MVNSPSNEGTLDYASPVKPTQSKALLWTGRVLSAIPVLFMGIGGIFFGLFNLSMVTEGMTKYGYPSHAALPILIPEIPCAIIYAIPQTATLGAILLTG